MTLIVTCLLAATSPQEVSIPAVKQQAQIDLETGQINRGEMHRSLACPPCLLPGAIKQQNGTAGTARDGVWDGQKVHETQCS